MNKRFIKSLCGDFNPQWWHDTIHCYVASELKPIEINGVQVNGVDGVGVPEFWGTTAWNEKYPALLDEARVGFHQVMVCPNPAYMARAIYYIWVLKKLGVCPASFIWQHWVSLR